MLCYCKKCGRIVQEEYNNLEQKCDYCNNNLEYIPQQFLIGKRGIAINDELKDQFINDYIKSSSEFDQYLFEHREEDMFNKRMSDRAKLAHGASILEEKSRVPKCPTCGSTNIKKMGGVERGASIAAFGIFSKKINKTFKCGNCGYTWWFRWDLEV